MSSGIVELVALGLVAIIAGMLFLAVMVREIAPAARRKLLLGLGLGSGVLAFSLKIALIVVFSAFPGAMLGMFPAETYRNTTYPAVGDDQSNSDRPVRGRAYTWGALPDTAPFPRDNPPSPQKTALGKRLFFDKRLSANGSVSCASCHSLAEDQGGSDGRPTSIGIREQRGTRNAPTVLNAAFQRVLFWDGRAASLEEQAKAPLINPVEMGMPSLESVEERVRASAEYRQAFADVFAARPSITIDNIAKAIAAYERTLITPNSPYDRFIRGDTRALTEQQLRGMALFQAIGCVYCHSGANFSGASVFGKDAAYRLFPTAPDTDFEIQYHLAEDRGAAHGASGLGAGIWRIPSLRNVSRTAPYFHNGSVESLDEAVRIMAHLQLYKKLSNRAVDDRAIYWSGQDRQLTVLSDQAVSDTEVEEIVSFLEALSGEIPSPPQ